jgi:hypothetical protein
MDYYITYMPCFFSSDGQQSLIERSVGRNERIVLNVPRGPNEF